MAFPGVGPIGPNLIQNGSFSPLGAPADFSGKGSGGLKGIIFGATIPSWSVAIPPVAWMYDSNDRLITGEGGYFVDLTNNNSNPTTLADYSYLYGEIVSAPFATDVGRNYQVSFNIGTYEQYAPNGSYNTGGPVAVRIMAGDLTDTVTQPKLKTGSGTQWGMYYRTFRATFKSTTVSFRGYIPAVFGRPQSSFIGLANVSVNELPVSLGAALAGAADSALATLVSILGGDIHRAQTKTEDVDRPGS